MNVSAVARADLTLLNDSKNNEQLFINLATVTGRRISIIPPAQSCGRCTKLMQKNYKNILLIVFLTLQLGCKKNLDAGIKTNVSGMVLDYNTQQPIANIPIYIYEFVTGFYGGQSISAIDSTKSGVDGSYDISFATTGKGIQYTIAFSPGEEFFSRQNNVVLHVGKDTMVNFYATQFHVLKARLQMTENPNPPMRVSNIAGLQANVWGTNNDTIIFMKIIPNQIDEIQFTITNVDTPSIYNYQIDTINFSGFQDTFNMTIPVVPKNFPKRG